MSGDSEIPTPRVPIDVGIVEEVAGEYGVGQTDLVEALETVDAHVAERARDLTERSVRELGEDAVVFRADVQQHLHVEPDEYEEIRAQLDLEGDVTKAVRAAHDRQCDRYAERIDGVERPSTLANYDVLVMATPVVQELLEAGLSHRQANVQALRMTGDSHRRIGEKLGVAPGTVKSHCDRIDRKIERAETLLELVGRTDR